MRRMTFGVAMAVILAALTVTGQLAAAGPEGFASNCPQMTDSVYRLYSAYFLREPDQAGWAYWSGVFGSSANTNLEVISDSFARSAEFVARYGTLSNAAFVGLLYNNVMEREPDDGGLAHWVGALGRGYPRGSVMMAFSESAEFVARTHTFAPQAGYLQWYDRGLQFRCGRGLSVGNYSETVAIPRSITTPYLDVMIVNLTADVSNVAHNGLNITTGGVGDPIEVTLDWGESAYIMNIPLPARADQVWITGDPGIAWSIVFYDHPHSPYRDGYPWLYVGSPLPSEMQGWPLVTDVSRLR